MQQTWQDMQGELAGLSSNTTRLTARGGHMIPVEQPGGVGRQSGQFALHVLPGLLQENCYFFSDGEGETKLSSAVLLYSR